MKKLAWAVFRLSFLTKFRNSVFVFVLTFLVFSFVKTAEAFQPFFVEKHPFYLVENSCCLFQQSLNLQVINTSLYPQPINNRFLLKNLFTIDFYILNRFLMILCFYFLAFLSIRGYALLESDEFCIAYAEEGEL